MKNARESVRFVALFCNVAVGTVNGAIGSVYVTVIAFCGFIFRNNPRRRECRNFSKNRIRKRISFFHVSVANALLYR